MRTSYCFFCLAISLLFLCNTGFGQTANFEETWREFLENNKISNMSALTRPSKDRDQARYIQYLLMNTNSNFCQSDVEDAEQLMAEIHTIDPTVHQSIPGFVGKMRDLEGKMEAFHLVDIVWKKFLESKEVPIEELQAITAAPTSCEKKTLAKYSYMMAYHNLCQGNVATAKNIFETRTLRLAEKTTLRVQDVEGLLQEVRRMKTLFVDMEKLDVAWSSFVRTGVSPGFDIELPLFPCFPIPKMKEFVLKGIVDPCSTGPRMLEQIKSLQAQSGVTVEGDLEDKIQDLESTIQIDADRIAILNTAWEAFLPDNKVKHMGQYGYEYCETEPLIRAYILDGFAYVCEAAEEMLFKVDSLRRADRVELDPVVLTKIRELEETSRQYKADGAKIEELWHRFVGAGDRLTEDYISADIYCDNIHQVKDWAMRGLSASCEEAPPFLEQIEYFQRTFEFNFTPDLECRVQLLRIKIWECREQALLKLARIEAPDSPDARLEELKLEYSMGPRPDDCSDE